MKIHQKNKLLSYQKPGFTLVEILVSITIIVVLAAIVFVLSKNIKKSALQGKSVSALRQIAVLTSSFTTENNGNIHHLRGENDPLVQGDYVKNSFWGRLIPYLAPHISTNNQKQMARELAPSLSSIFGTDNLPKMKGTLLEGSSISSDRAGNQLPSPLTFNRKILPKAAGTYSKVQNFDDPGQTLYFTYGFWYFDPADGQTFARLPNKKPKETSNIYWFDNKTAPMVFLDGHIDLLSVPIHQRLFE